MDYKDISKLIKLIDETNLAEFKMRDGDFSIRIRTDKYSSGRVSGQEAQFVTIPQAAAPQEMVVPQAKPAAGAPPAVAETSGSDAAAEESTANLLEVKSPIVGTFYRSSAPDKPPYIKVGDVISEGDVVCIVEAMKLFNEIESEISGKVVKVMVEDAAPVEYDQVLFLIDPQG